GAFPSLRARCLVPSPVFGGGLAVRCSTLRLAHSLWRRSHWMTPHGFGQTQGATGTAFRRCQTTHAIGRPTSARLCYNELFTKGNAACLVICRNQDGRKSCRRWSMPRNMKCPWANRNFVHPFIWRQACDE